ncbi:phosphate transporter family protein [Nitzschia inconspicua]|uniref:Phosphate transporter family protein n=1 Tax=Nitzschia inconspicua TaxID=303405 RepID=A0A9K3PS68_9STRA|nr:phosphate transporter family protein [Nitzschia inconspicua]
MANGPPGGFNKLFIMIPVMLAARKIDAENPDTVYWLRVAYGSVQSICVLIVLYTYIQASTFASSDGKTIVYVPSAPTPFADPNAKKKYTEVSYGAHIVSTARSLVGSTLFGVALTVGLHLYKGMAMGLAIQAVMGPINLIENPVVKALLLGNGFQPQDKIFDEKSANELAEDDEIVDEAGNPVVARQLGGSTTTTTTTTKAKTTTGQTFEELLLDTWDAGNKADIGAFMEAVTKENCNYRTKENGWTPLMILAGLNAKGTASAIRQVIELGGNPAIVDVEGWNALHWAAFHGSLEAAKALAATDATLLTVQDKEGKLPIDMAKAEGNDQVATFFESLVVLLSDNSDTNNNNNNTTEEGLRKRK